MKILSQSDRWQASEAVASGCLAIKNLAMQGLMDMENAEWVLVAIVALAEKAGIQSDLITSSLGGGPGVCGDFAGWTETSRQRLAS